MCELIVKELELSLTDPITKLSSELYACVLDLFPNIKTKTNNWISIRIIDDKDLDLIYESDTLKEKIKQGKIPIGNNSFGKIISDKLIYKSGLDKEIKLVQDFLKSGLDADLIETTEAKYLVEIHIANSSSPDQMIESTFSPHQDDYGGIDCKVYTGICYLTNTCEIGGDIAFFDSEGFETLKKIVSTKPSSDNMSKFIGFYGDITHCPTKAANGIRIAVSYQLERN